MTRIILGLSLLALAIGCTGIHPVGPLARPNSGLKSLDDDDSKVVSVPAPKPTPPLNLVDPSDVDADPHAAAQRLMSELEGDRKTISSSPTTAEVSHYKRGVKQN